MPGADASRPCAGTNAAGDVEPAVADHERPRRIETQVAARLFDHPRSRLAAAAHLPVPLDWCVSEMRTVVVAINRGAAACQPRRQLPMNLVEERFIDDPASD